MEPELESDYIKNKIWNRVLESSYVWNLSPKPKLRFWKGGQKKKTRIKGEPGVNQHVIAGSSLGYVERMPTWV